MTAGVTSAQHRTGAGPGPGDRSRERSLAEEARLAAVYARRQETVPADRYTYFNRANLVMIQDREWRVLRLLTRHGWTSLTGKTILEIGCGAGPWLRDFVRWGAEPENVAGIDLLPDLIAEARRRCPEAVRLQCSSATATDFPDASFDLVLQSTVFTSVLDAASKRQLAAEMLRLVKPEGLILWYDFRVDNPWNRDVRGVNRAEIRDLFPGCDIDLRGATLAPPLVRLLAPYSFLACYLLAKIPFFCTHYVGAIRKRT